MLCEDNYLDRDRFKKLVCIQDSFREQLNVYDSNFKDFIKGELSFNDFISNLDYVYFDDNYITREQNRLLEECGLLESFNDMVCFTLNFYGGLATRFELLKIID